MALSKLRVSTHSGFTLIEIIIIVMIVGIISVAIMPRSNQTGLVVQYQARQVLNDIRYAQAMSMSTGQRYRWVKSSATTYQLINASGSPLLLPNGTNSLVLAGGTVFGTISQLPNSLITFDAFGVPYTTTGLPGTALSAPATITLVNGSDSSVITIYPATGLGKVT